MVTDASYEWTVGFELSHWTSLCPLSSPGPKPLWKEFPFLRADAGGQTGTGWSS